MNRKHVQVVAAAIAILGAAVLAKVLEPRTLMARSSSSLDLQRVIPTQFGQWKLVPQMSPVTPGDPEGYVDDPDSYSRIYSQEVGRTYTDNQGHIVMLMVAYGPVQNFRLKAHRPEFCYTAAGFRVSGKTDAEMSYRNGAPPIRMTRLVAERESRLEPISYWMRVGNDVSNGVVDRQLIRLKYGLKGLIPDGALIRVSTIGLPPQASFELQEQFIRDLLAAIPQRELSFFTGA